MDLNKIEHYGKKLEKEINDKKYSKTHIADILGISYNTLIKRLNDGEFTQSQLHKLVDNRFL